MTKPPITARVVNLRQRRRADGTWRVWWEPDARARAAGVKPVELDADRLTWSVREAKRLNDEAASATGKAPARTGGNTMARLIGHYRKDPIFTDLKPKTQVSYRRNLKVIEEKWGAYPVAAFDKPTMREWYLTCYRTRGQTMAKRLIAMCSILFAFAELKGWRPEDSNPCSRLKMKEPAPRDRVATWAELDAILDAATTLGRHAVGTAALLAALQGQRQTDILQAVAGDFVEVPAEPMPVRAWRIERSKRGTLGLLPLHPIVLDRLLPLLDGRDADAPLLTDEATGRAYDEDLFQKRWGEVRTEAAKHCRSLTGRDQLQFRDLRRSFSVWARAGGATDDDVGDVLGNSAALDPRLQDIYMPPSFDTARRAVLSIARPDPEKRKKA